jgi:hypothetical protein
MSGTTISSTITHSVTLGYGVTLNLLTITNTGEVRYAGGYAILAGNAYDGTIVNAGSISGRTDGVYAPRYAVTIFNSGSIYGDQAGLLLESAVDGAHVVVNSGAISGNFGIAGSDADVTNTGTIDGVNFGVHLAVSTIVNSGTITGQEGVNAQQDVLSNSGLIDGSQTGLYLGGGSAVNSGTITGVLGVQIGNFAGAGSLTNNGMISGGAVVIGGFLDNAAQITGGTGVSLGIAGIATNSGQIYGQSYGVVISGPANAVNERFVNSGTIYSPNEGIVLAGTYAKNSGSLAGGKIGAAISAGRFVNYGSISSPDLAVEVSGGNFSNSGSLAGQVDGVAISGGMVTNFGSISGASDGAVVTAGSLANYGGISGVAYGVAELGGNVTNYGLISAAANGVLVSHGMLTNAGTIQGGVNAVYGSFMTLDVEPGAVFTGNVINTNGPSLLELGGAGVGSLGGIGTQIKGFEAIEFSSGANWVVSGDVAGLAGGETISGMSRVDTIVLDGFAEVSQSFVSGVGLEMSDGTTTVTLDITGFFPNGLQVAVADGNTVITDVTCFAAGTRIATPAGNIPVEQLKIGELVRTLNAGDRPVKWIGWRKYDGRMIQGNKAALPVCIRQDAIADGVPARDLLVSPGHAIAIDQLLVHASRLVNGVSVVQLGEVESVTYYHIELESHAILLAENCPAESFCDEHFRQQFANWQDYRRLYPDDLAPAALCLPRLASGFLLHAIQSRIAARAGIAEAEVTGPLRGYVDQTGPELCFGWAQDMLAPEAPVSLDIFCGGSRIGRVLANLYRRDVSAAGYGSGFQGFEFLLPAGLSGAIEVRRTADGARLELADGAVQRAA